LFITIKSINYTSPQDYVSPVFKAGDKGSMSNYRPISVLPTIAKVFEKL